MQKSILKFAVLSMIAAISFTSCKDKDNTVPVDPKDDVTLQSGATLEGNITRKHTRLVEGGTYTLKAKVHVKEGATLHIPAGVTIKSDVNPDATAYLLIEPGAKIEAIGTATKPIVFTSGQTNPKPQDWGGIILCGRAPINVPGGISPSEMGENVNYGGTKVDDNSGTLRYVRVEYTGKKQTLTKEHNGFTFEGVGNGTTVEYISSYRGGDDGIEWFGGTVNVKYAVVYGAQDDMFDYTFGWSGKAQFLLGVQEQENTASFKAVGDRAFEVDNNEDNHAATHNLLTMATISNVTLVGSLVAVTGDDPTTATATGSTRALKLRRGAKGKFYNMLVTNFSSGIEVENDASLTAMTEGSLIVKNSDIANAKPWSYKPNANSWTGAKPFETADYKNTVTSAFSSNINKTTYVGTNATDAINPTTLDSWFTSAQYKGAVSSSNNWLGAWAGTLQPITQ